MTKVPYACWLRIFKCSFLSAQLLFSRLENVLPTRYTEERNVCIAYIFCGVWRLLENMREWEYFLWKSHWRECVSPASENVEKRKSVWKRSINRKYVSWSRLQKRRTKFEWGRSFKHWSRGSPGQWFLETEYLRASAIIVSGTSDIPPIFKL